MKLIAFIEESVLPQDNFIIVSFRADKSKQPFQVFIEDPYLKKIRKYDERLLDVKFRSVVMKDLDGSKTYDTQLYTEIAVEVTEKMRNTYN